MSVALDVVVTILYALGLFFNLAAVVGIIRLPDVYCRLHSSSKNTTLGSLLIVLGLAIRQVENDAYPSALKLLFIGFLLLMINPIGSHALARAAYLFGVPLWEGTVCDQYPLASGEGKVVDDQPV
jgi:multicomponent Na+:H+ antiporter subunit G